MASLVIELQAKTSPVSDVEKFRQPLFFSLYHHFELQSEVRSRVFQDLFDELIPAVISICSQHHWLLSYEQKTGRKFRPHK